MPVATTPSASPRPSTLVKMEDRKRPAISGGEDLAPPPSKRVAINGSKAKDENADMKEDYWVEAFTKGAIYRQMQEYSRKAATAEARLEELHKRSVHHDDHIRIVDAWWRQMLEELELLVESAIPTTESRDFKYSYVSGIAFKDLQHFQSHLQEMGKSIKTKAETLVTRLAAQRENIAPKTSELESQIANLLAVQKEYHLNLDRLSAEKEQLSEQLNAATLRYFKAEKKLDRAKSAQVQRLEQQAFANATRPVTTPTEGGSEPSEANGNALELTMKYEEAAATVAKQKEQLDALYAELKALQEENTSLKSRRETLSDEDYIRTDVFKQFKSQNEELIKRVNTLEASSKQLREDAEKFQAERTAFRAQLEADMNLVAQEYEADIAARDQDLARVRSARDEILAENVQRRANAEQERIAMEHIKELVSAKEDRISALESELARLKPASPSEETSGGGDAEELSDEELRQRYKKLKQDFESINQELPAMEKAYKKMKDLAQKKVLDFVALEEKVAVLIAEKSKADQKYFAARKDADTRNSEIRTLRHQSVKSAELIAQLKDFESQTRTLLSNLEKQLADLKQANAVLVAENKKMEASSLEAVRRSESVAKQVSDLTNLVKSKDSASAIIRERNAMQEVEVEKLKIRVEHVQKDRDSWKNKALSNSSEEEDMLRTMALCPVCHANFKNTALKTCGHLFCNKCVDDRISNRMRKCPSCSRAFDKMDVMQVHF
ncbi:BRE1 domain-containing protein [Trichoderma novae-zelandiae]